MGTKIGKSAVKNVYSTDGWVKKQLIGEKKGRFSTFVPCFLGVLHGKMWTRAEGTDWNALVATEQKTGIMLKEDLIYGNDNRKKNCAA